MCVCVLGQREAPLPEHLPKPDYESVLPTGDNNGRANPRASPKSGGSGVFWLIRGVVCNLVWPLLLVTLRGSRSALPRLHWRVVRESTLNLKRCAPASIRSLKTARSSALATSCLTQMNGLNTNSWPDSLELLLYKTTMPIYLRPSGSRQTSAGPARAEIRGVACPLLSPVGST